MKWLLLRGLKLNDCPSAFNSLDYFLSTLMTYNEATTKIEKNIRADYNAVLTNHHIINNIKLTPQKRLLAWPEAFQWEKIN